MVSTVGSDIIEVDKSVLGPENSELGLGTEVAENMEPTTENTRIAENEGTYNNQASHGNI